MKILNSQMELKSLTPKTRNQYKSEPNPNRYPNRIDSNQTRTDT